MTLFNEKDSKKKVISFNFFFMLKTILKMFYYVTIFPKI